MKTGLASIAIRTRVRRRSKTMGLATHSRWGFSTLYRKVETHPIRANRAYSELEARSQRPQRGVQKCRAADLRCSKDPTHTGCVMCANTQPPNTAVTKLQGRYRSSSRYYYSPMQCPLNYLFACRKWASTQTQDKRSASPTRHTPANSTPKGVG
jgi:hypothetical protein